MLRKPTDAARMISSPVRVSPVKVISSPGNADVAPACRVANVFCRRHIEDITYPTLGVRDGAHRADVWPILVAARRERQHRPPAVGAVVEAGRVGGSNCSKPKVPRGEVGCRDCNLDNAEPTVVGEEDLASVVPTSAILSIP